MSSAEDVWTPIRGSESPPHLTWKHAVADALKKTHCERFHAMNTAHPEVAVLLHGEDEWLAELVSRSECVGQRACSSNLSDGASSATTGRRSIHDPEVALLLRGEENWLAELVSRSEPSLVQVSSASDDNQDVEKKSVPASSISSQKLGEKLNRVYKWGACPRCGGARSLQPHVLSENSKTPGKLVLYCSGWWKAGSQNGRACWYQQDFPQDRKNEISRFLKDKYTDLRMSLHCNGCLGRSSDGDS